MGRPKSTYAFYFVKIRSFEDPQLREKFMDAQNKFEKEIQARSKIIEAVRAKKMERSTIISELKPLTAQNKRYNEVVAEKLKEMELPQNRLGMFLKNDDMQAQRAGFCSSVEELEQTIKMSNDRIAHKSISLREEKCLANEIKNLEKNISKVIYNSTIRAKLQDTVDGNEIRQDQVRIIDGTRKEQQAVRSKIKGLEDELRVVDTEIASIQEDLDAATARKDKAYESLVELRTVHDAKNASLIENCCVLDKARDYASRRLVAELGALHEAEVDKFMAQWCNSKAFREDYEKRTISSLIVRQLDRDGRMRIPDY
ncbi:proton pump-interactor BIP103 [Sorghum bicolor]|nr:proton pump-interactor BIP103 [Sorghum bicolor]|eukprot:XP_002460088.2 proton pump-interactor BIP103 [Sorghum bicolor]